MSPGIAKPSKLDEALQQVRAALHRGDAKLAEERCREVLGRDANCAAAWVLLGMCLRKRDASAAEEAFQRALLLAPNDADAVFHLANLQRQRGALAVAIEGYQRVLQLVPGQLSVMNNLGLALEANGELTRAQALFREILGRQREHPQALRNLVRLLCRMHRYAEAAPLCIEYLKRFPESDADLWADYALCVTHLQPGDYERVQECYRRALRLAPGDVAILTNLGSLYLLWGKFEAAAELFRQCLADSRAGLYALTSLGLCRQHLCAWEDLPALHSEILNRVESTHDEPLNVFITLSMPAPAATQLRMATRWAGQLQSAPAASRAPAIGRSARLRLGYVSSDFRPHPTAYLLTEVWERHDRARFATHAYALAPRDRSALGARIEAAFDRFNDCSGEDAGQIAQRIRADGIDLIIDLNGYTTHARSELFAERPASVQINWLGYPGTLGADWYDYVITDRFLTPAAEQANFSERFLYLPHCYCPSDTRRAVTAQVPSREACGLPPGAFVFCCFNNQYKILPELFAAWMRLLDRVPASVLWLSPANETAAANLRREACARGVAAERLIFAPRVSAPEHLARHVHANLFLDTAPFNAGATANDALFMGLPLLTFRGATMAGRMAGSQLYAIGLPELVRDSVEDYEAAALQLAREPKHLAEYRERLRAHRTSFPLFDMARFTADLEDALASVV